MAGNYSFDKSGNGNRGTLTGSNGLPVRTSGKLGQGMGFDGVDDYIELPGAFNNFSSWTFTHWVRSPAAPTGDNVEQTFQNAEAFGFSWDHTNPTVRQAIYMRDSGMNYLAGKFTSTLQANTWYFIAGTWDGVTRRAYLNGIQEATETESDALSAGSGCVCIGAGFNRTSNFKGQIDDVRIYNRALSADEIKRLYNMGR
jgi:hypothetical protein